MRIWRFGRADERATWRGISLLTGQVIDLPAAGEAAGIDVPHDTARLLGLHDWRSRVEQAVEHAEPTGDALLDQDRVTRHAPVEDPGKVICVGLNYRDHAEAGGQPDSRRAGAVHQVPTAITGPSSQVSWDPNYATKVDYEAELIVVIGQEAREVGRDEALDRVVGYTIGNTWWGTPSGTTSRPGTSSTVTASGSGAGASTRSHPSARNS